MPNICNDDHYKDSCKYSIEIAKQFITLASGGVAFVVGLLISSNKVASYLFYWLSGSFILSIGFGLIYVMSTIAHINKEQNYNVYSPKLKFLAATQIIFFIIGLILLVYTVLWKLESKIEKQNIDSLCVEINLKDNKITYKNVKQTNTELNVSGNDKFEFKTHSSK
jgi:uncharacterized membrane protein YczE